MTNFVVVVADQLRADFLGCYGATCIDTPHIDRLAQNGITYDRALSPTPLCVPARASLLVGENAITTGVLGNRFWLRPDRCTFGMATWPERLAGAGYDTIAVGKCHFTPWDAAEGFARRIIAEDKRRPEIKDDYYDHCRAIGLPSKPVPREEPGYDAGKSASVSAVAEKDYVDVWVADQTVGVIEDLGRDRPFALFVGFPSPHCPYNPPASYLDAVRIEHLTPIIPDTDMSRRRFDAQTRTYRSEVFGVDLSTFTEAEKTRIRHHYAAMVKLIDDQIGKIVAALEKEGLSDDTVIIVASDHGDHLGDFGLLGKTTFLEPSVRIPLVLAAGANVEAAPQAGARSPDLVVLHDLFATLVHLAGLEAKAGDSFVLPGIGPHDLERRRTAFGALTGGWALFEDTRKLIVEADGSISLFDIASDPWEQTDLFAEGGPSVLAELLGRLGPLLPQSIMRGAIDRSFPYLTYQDGEPYQERGWVWEYPYDGRAKPYAGWSP